ncbi:MAG: acyl-CoA dehydrogenase family protein, partial [Actinomycetota bacterium]|nr:acyl-CoA dehydrogenase family protein [Actinomycetota bacterium]
MSELRPSPNSTHEVINQPDGLEGYNLFDTDPTVTSFLERTGAVTEELWGLGQWLGTPEAMELGRQANVYPPTLRPYDARGNRIDEVEFHPSYHRLMSTTIGAGIASFPEQDGPDPNHHLKRAVGMYLISQNEAGHGCPISMTYAAVPSLRHNPALAAVYEPLLQAHSYAPELVPAASKGSATAGMAMTEKQGGSDLRANTTVADLGESGEALLTGHKWFCSAPMSDLFLTLARDKDGLSCYLVPRVLEDGTRNSFLIRRLKDKLGNRSNASSEIEYDHTVGYRVGEPGRGVKTIMDMV